MPQHSMRARWSRIYKSVSKFQPFRWKSSFFSYFFPFSVSISHLSIRFVWKRPPLVLCSFIRCFISFDSNKQEKKKTLKIMTCINVFIQLKEREREREKARYIHTHLFTNYGRFYTFDSAQSTLCLMMISACCRAFFSSGFFFVFLLRVFISFISSIKSNQNPAKPSWNAIQFLLKDIIHSLDFHPCLN